MFRSGILLLMCIVLLPWQAGAEEITLVKRARRADPAEFTSYTVQPGDTLWKILVQTRNARYNDFPYLYKKFRELNPEITDLNHIISGRRIRIPNIPKGREEFSVQATPEDVYVIKKGQHLAMILRQVYGLPDHLIFNEYLNLIKELNPEIENLDLVEAGQRVRIPQIKQVVDATREAALAREAAEAAASGNGKKPDQLLRELIEQKVHELTLQQKAAEQEKQEDQRSRAQAPDDQAAAVSILESLRRQRTAPPKIDKDEKPVQVSVAPAAPATEKAVPREKIDPPKKDRAEVAAKPKPAPKPKPIQKTKPAPAPSRQEVSAPSEKYSPAPEEKAGEKPDIEKTDGVSGGLAGEGGPPVTSELNGGEGQEKASPDAQPKQSAISRIVKNTLLPALTRMGGRQKDEGTYFMPMAGGSSVSIDTGEIPVIELDTGMRVILDMNSRISPEVKDILEQAFPTCRIISGPHEGLESLMDRVLNVSEYFSVNKDAGPLLVGEDEKIRFSGKWIVYKDFSRQNVFVINLLDEADQQTPDPIRSYASRFGIDLIEMGGKPWVPKGAASETALIELGHSYRKLLDLLGKPYELDKELELVSLEALRIAYEAPLLYNRNIILTEELPDKTMSELLAKKGYTVVDASSEAFETVLDTLGIEHQGPPVKTVVAEKRTELELPAVKVGEVVVLLGVLDTDIARYLASTGMKIAVW
ncbi:MAG TPA: LysM domain-containing protein [Deltaproteobacteria bacterium]|nr:LysM domain-containing protein [Deltaproteobacteria bacterium]